MILSTNSQPAKSPLGRKQPSFQLVFSKKKRKKTKKGELTHQLINLTQYSLVERFKIKKPNLVVNWIHNRKIQNYKSPISSLTEFRIERKKTKKNPVSCSSKILGISGYPSFKNFYMLAEKPYPLRDGISRTARSRGKLWALRSCITSIPRLARLIISAQELITTLAINYRLVEIETI